jgi:hypothetical protein
MPRKSRPPQASKDNNCATLALRYAFAVGRFEIAS